MARLTQFQRRIQQARLKREAETPEQTAARRKEEAKPTFPKPETAPILPVPARPTVAIQEFPTTKDIEAGNRR